MIRLKLTAMIGAGLFACQAGAVDDTDGMLEPIEQAAHADAFGDLSCNAAHAGNLEEVLPEGFEPPALVDTDAAADDTASPVPEPGSMAILGLGALFLLQRRRD